VVLQGETVGRCGHGRHFGIATRRPTLPESASCAGAIRTCDLSRHRADRRARCVSVEKTQHGAH
jgi:hypothetical protein